jgi:hypothetical protein
VGDARVGVVRVKDAGLSGAVLLGAQGLLEMLALGGVGVDAAIEQLGYRAPARPGGQDLLLGERRGAVFGVEAGQYVDDGQVGLDSGLRAGGYPDTGTGPEVLGDDRGRILPGLGGLRGGGVLGGGRRRGRFCGPAGRRGRFREEGNRWEGRPAGVDDPRVGGEIKDGVVVE